MILRTNILHRARLFLPIALVAGVVACDGQSAVSPSDAADAPSTASDAGAQSSADDSGGRAPADAEAGPVRDAASDAAHVSDACAADACAPVRGKGVNAADMLFMDDAQRGQRAATLAALGVGWARLDFDWSVIQKDGPNAYDYAALDATVSALSGVGIAVLAVIDYSPSWANGGQPSSYFPPLQVSDYATFAAHTAQHFAPLGVHAWEIWNEENTGQFWGGKADPAAYAALLKAAYPAVKQADPAAIVVTGGLAQPYADANNWDARDFLSALYDDGAEGFFDAVGDHPYDDAVPGGGQDNNWQKMFATTPSFRSIMQAHGDGQKKIWVTEIGSPTNGPSSVTEQTQAQIVSGAFAASAGVDWLGPVVWYNDQDWCTDTTNSECFYGLLRADGSKKPSFDAFANAPSP